MIHKAEYLFIVLAFTWFMGSMMYYGGLISLGIEELLSVVLWASYAFVNCLKYRSLPCGKRPQDVTTLRILVLSFILVLAAICRACMLLFIK